MVMVNRTRWMVWGLCGVLSLGAIGCWGRNKTEEPPPDVGETTLSAPDEVTSTPTTNPSPAPVPPEPGVGGTGTAINPPQPAQLIASQPEAQINLRSEPTTDSEAKGYGLVGDSVELLRSTQASDGTWYYVKFDQSQSEGWIRGDFINTAGVATPLSQRANQSSTCEGLLESVTFTVFYDDEGFHLVRFTNLETKNSFDGTLSRQGSSNQGQPLYQGTASPPNGGSYAVEITDLSGGNPSQGSQIAIDYAGITGSGTCK
jgi:hypothetical protein